jgi:hypothetical protein
MFIGTYECTGQKEQEPKSILCTNCSIVLARLYSFLSQSEDFVTLVHSLWCGEPEFEPAFARGRVCGIIYNIEKELQKKHDKLLGIRGNDDDLLNDLCIELD